MGFLVGAVASFLSLVELLIVIDAIMSWFIRPRSNEVSRAIGVVVDPILIPCSKLQSKIISNLPVDFAPVIAIILLELCKTIINLLF